MKLFGIETQVSPSLRSRLESSWAHLFRCEVLPLLLRKEDDYAMLYGTTGRPNFSVARLLGLCLLQEWNDLSDQEALDTFSFDVRWRYALDVGDEEDYLSRRSLVEFRRRLAAKDPEACKVIACNIKRWARALFSLRVLLNDCPLSLCVRLRLCRSGLIGASLVSGTVAMVEAA